MNIMIMFSLPIAIIAMLILRVRGIMQDLPVDFLVDLFWEGILITTILQVS